MSLLMERLDELAQKHGRFVLGDGSDATIWDPGERNLSVSVFNGDGEYIYGEGAWNGLDRGRIVEACKRPGAAGFVMDVYDDGTESAATDTFWVHLKELKGGEDTADSQPFNMGGA